MIILIEHNDGERYDTHYWINHIYDVNTDKNIDQLKLEHSDYVVNIMLEHRITVNPTWFNIMEDSKIKNKKLHKKLLKEHTFSNWLENTYTVKKLEYGQFGLYSEWIHDAS